MKIIKIIFCSFSLAMFGCATNQDAVSQIPANLSPVEQQVAQAIVDGELVVSGSCWSSIKDDGSSGNECICDFPNKVDKLSCKLDDEQLGRYACDIQVSKKAKISSKPGKNKASIDSMTSKNTILIYYKSGKLKLDKYMLSKKDIKQSCFKKNSKEDLILLP